MSKSALMFSAGLMALTTAAFAQTPHPADAGAQRSSSAQAPSDKGSQKDLQIQTVTPSDAMLDLKTAVRALREASVMLVEPGASKQPGPARQKAFQAAQDAIFKVQRAMVQLPAPYHEGEIRDAKAWPEIASRIDQASVAIEKAVNELDKEGKPNSAAVKSLNGALNDAEKALRSMPEWRIQGSS